MEPYRFMHTLKHTQTQHTCVGFNPNKAVGSTEVKIYDVFTHTSLCFLLCYYR